MQQERGLAQRAARLQFPWALMLTPSQPSLFTPQSRFTRVVLFFFPRQTRNIPCELNKMQGDAVAESRQRRDGKAGSREQSCSRRHRTSLTAGGTAGARHAEDLMPLLGTSATTSRRPPSGFCSHWEALGGVVSEEISEPHPQRHLFSLARAAGERGCGCQPTLLSARRGVWSSAGLRAVPVLPAARCCSIC